MKLIEELSFIIADTPEGEISESELQRYQQVHILYSIYNACLQICVSTVGVG